jgi:hypothetical protein
MTREEFISDIREIADFFEAHPDLKVMPSPYLFISDYSETAKESLRLFVKAAGKTTKEFSGNEFKVEKRFSNGFLLHFDVQRQAVCERVVTGTKVIPAISYPERTEDIVEWKCGSILEAVS